MPVLDKNENNPPHIIYINVAGIERFHWTNPNGTALR